MKLYTWVLMIWKSLIHPRKKSKVGLEKMFIIQVRKDGTWKSKYIFKGHMQGALLHARKKCRKIDSRIKRIKTPWELFFTQDRLNAFGKEYRDEEIEWVN